MRSDTGNSFQLSFSRWSPVPPGPHDHPRAARVCMVYVSYSSPFVWSALMTLGSCSTYYIAPRSTVTKGMASTITLQDTMMIATPISSWCCKGTDCDLRIQYENENIQMQRNETLVLSFGMPSIPAHRPILLGGAIQPSISSTSTPPCLRMRHI